MSVACTCAAGDDAPIAAHDYYCDKKLEYNKRWDLIQ